MLNKVKQIQNKNIVTLST